jgi:hypothetical protein
VGLHPPGHRAESGPADGGKSGDVVCRLKIFKESGGIIVTRAAGLCQGFVTGVGTQLVTPRRRLSQASQRDGSQPPHAVTCPDILKAVQKEGMGWDGESSDADVAN